MFSFQKQAGNNNECDTFLSNATNPVSVFGFKKIGNTFFKNLFALRCSFGNIRTRQVRKILE